MKILKREQFNEELKEILYFIAKDSKANAKKFKNILFQKLQNLGFMPYKFRKSIFFNDENIRDFIFKGYIIAYSVNEAKETIILIGIVKYKEAI